MYVIFSSLADKCQAARFTEEFPVFFVVVICLRIMEVFGLEYLLTSDIKIYVSIEVAIVLYIVCFLY